MNDPPLRAISIILSSLLMGLLSTSAAFAREDALPPYTDYCEMLAQESQGRKHAFLAGNLTYYVGGRYACWRPIEDETIGLTHPFYHDLRGRGFGLAKHAGSGFGHDFRGWEFYNNTRIAYGTVIVGDREYACPVPTSMRWRPDKVICTYRVGDVGIREEKFIAGNDVACSIITSESPVMLRFDGHSLVIPKLSIDRTSTVRFDESNNAVHITEGGTVVTQPVENETCTGRLIYDGMSTVLSCSSRIASYTAHTDNEGRQVYSFQTPCDRRGVAITWAMDDEYAKALAASQSVLADYRGSLAAKTKAMNDLLNYQIPYFRCSVPDTVRVYYYLWAIYLMYYIDVGQGWEMHPHTQTAVNNFLGMHRYDANFQIKVGAWTADKERYAYGNVLHWKSLLPFARPGGRLPDNKGIAWYSPVWGATTEHVIGAWQIYQHTGGPLVILLALVRSLAAADQEHDYPLAPVSFEKVTLQDSFWLPRLKLQAESTVPHALVQTKPAVENLRRCGNFLHGRSGELPFPHRFVSSDLYKVMEGAAYLLMIKPDPALERQLDEIIDVIAEAQQDDGYLYVSHICGVARPREMGETTYSWVVHSHELYNMGHMYEGAVAYYRATGKDKWLRVAEKSARHINKVFFEGDPNYNGGRPVMQAPGHEELELALCKLYRVTGNRLYLDMANRFLDIRGVTYRPEGEGTMSPSYAQQHKPVVEQTEAVGHAVRAGYLYAGMADVSALTGDMSYAHAAEKIWHDIVDTKMHIIGGLGATHGIEGFGPAYDLPNRQTYNETCAAVANVLFNFRMYLLHKDAKYFDVAEVALLNNSLAGMGMAGDSFFYVNVLETDGVPTFNHGSRGRAEWFGCACCPSNLARLIPQVSGYMYSHTVDEIYLGLYGSSHTEISLAGGDVTIEQESNYPFEGKVRLKIDPSADLRFALKLRIPTWAREQFVPGSLYEYVDGLQPEWTLKVNGKAMDASPERGFATIQRTWKAGDTVELDLPMPVRYSKAVDQVQANRDRIAITRGPFVYCAEQADNPATQKTDERADIVQRFFIPGPADPSEVQEEIIDGGLLQGVVRVSVPAMEIPEKGTGPICRNGPEGASHKLDLSPFPSTVKLIPYYAWNNRGEDSMIVWLPRSESLARKYMVSNHLTAADYGKVLATHTAEGDTVAAVVDGRVPDRSDDQAQPRWTSLPFKNRGENIIFEFDKRRTVGSIAIYWYEEPGGEGEKVRLPRNWWVEYRVGEGEWTRMKTYVTDDYGLERDKFNVVRPAASLNCDAISIRILPQVGYCMGVHEVQLEFDE